MTLAQALARIKQLEAQLNEALLCLSYANRYRTPGYVNKG